MSTTHGPIEHDFALPSTTSNGTSKPAPAWSLQQTSPQVQALIPISSASNPTYTFTTPHRKRKEKNKPDVVIEKSVGKEKVVLGTMRVDPSREECVIRHAHGGVAQTIGVDRGPKTRYVCQMGQTEMYWQSLGPSRTVLELVGVDGKRVEVFVYTSDPAQQIDPATGLKVKHRKGEIGVLHIAGIVLGAVEVEKVLFAGIGVVAMRKGRC